jgi:hypothetical protein
LVLAWVVPVDALLFTPLSYGGENRALERLRTADVIIEPHLTMKR